MEDGPMPGLHRLPVPLTPEAWARIRWRYVRRSRVSPVGAHRRVLCRCRVFAEPLWGVRGKPAPIAQGRRPATTREALEVYSYFLRAFSTKPELAERADLYLRTVLLRQLDTEHAKAPTEYLRVDRIA